MAITEQENRKSHISYPGLYQTTQNFNTGHKGNERSIHWQRSRTPQMKIKNKTYEYRIVTDTSRKRFDTTKLQRPRVRKAFSMELKNKFQLVDDIEDIETFWVETTNCYKETATNTLGFKERGICPESPISHGNL